MIVHLMRHAKTEVHSTTGRDYDRKLALKGHAQCTQLQEIFKTTFTNRSKICCSSAQRTRETAQLIFNDEHPVLYFDELYLCSASTILQVIREQESVEELLVIGHNFGLSELASYFLGKDVFMKTGGLISIDFPGLSIQEISNSSGELISMHRCDLEE